MRYGTDLLGTSNVRLDGWALDRGVLAELDAHLWRTSPKVIVECGSGVSTLLFARYAKASGATVVTLEHELRYWDRTRRWLKADGLLEYVEMLRAPLVDTAAGPWYAGASKDLPHDIDFALIDGPPEAKGGRAATLPNLLPHMRPDSPWAVWVDDADRPGEKKAINTWIKQHKLYRNDIWVGRGLVELGPRSGATTRQPAIDASDTVITILTGQRPDLLGATLGALESRAPGLLETATVAILNNGADEDTSRVVRMLHRTAPHAKEHRTKALLPIGPATSSLASLARDSGQAYWLHLEDDWQLATAHPGWFDEARHLLRTRALVHQVRLRHLTEPTLLRHMYTKKPIVWRGDLEPTASALLAQAHWTFNPALTRVSEIGDIFPTSGEPWAIRKAHEQTMDTHIAQHVPGVFRHIGGTDSLADKTGGR
jgi:predicted O-methyltransferase YrrM